MKDRVIIDTGPLTAFLNSRDRYHEWTVSQLKQIAGPLTTCEAVLSETEFLLGQAPKGTEKLTALLRQEGVRVSFSLSGHVEAVCELLCKYANVPMSMTDACLVRLCETARGSSILTLDSDFRIYRKSDGSEIPLIVPP